MNANLRTQGTLQDKLVVLILGVCVHLAGLHQEHRLDNQTHVNDGILQLEHGMKTIFHLGIIHWQDLAIS
jgi:hypothetical protein